jgi:hypothetical protein
MWNYFKFPITDGHLGLLRDQIWIEILIECVSTAALYTGAA